MTATNKPSKEQQAAIAAHRFGLGEASLAGIGGDAVAWLGAQIGPAEPQRGNNLASGLQGLRHLNRFVRARRQLGAAGTSEMALNGALNAAMNGAVNGERMTALQATDMNAAKSIEKQFADHFRELVQGDLRARLSTAALSVKPFNERLALFWANHFTVSGAKAGVRGVVGAYEREAIRPHIGGSFEALLKAAVTHAAMLRYLDNDRSAGPRSQIVTRLARRAERVERAPRGDRNGPNPGADPMAARITGLNENLAREVLELHTLGVSGGGAAYGGWGGYTQTDVTELARVLTGWRIPLRDIDADNAASFANAATTQFDPAWHDPGAKTVLGQRYAEGPDALNAVLHDLAVHPSTARFVSMKLARHFCADEPPASLVARLEDDFRNTEGDLPSLYRTLIRAPEAWSEAPTKLKTPEEFVISSARLLKLGEQMFVRLPDAAISQLGQRVQGAPSPAGWPDRAEEWLGPDAVWKRVEWATRVADRWGRQVDARALAQASLGPRLQASTLQQIERAADGPQALALLLLAPEFQRR
jgi:uncharacterized protein (DUF1800 family)